MRRIYIYIYIVSKMWFLGFDICVGTRSPDRRHFNIRPSCHQWDPSVAKLLLNIHIHAMMCLQRNAHNDLDLRINMLLEETIYQQQQWFNPFNPVTQRCAIREACLESCFFSMGWQRTEWLSADGESAAHSITKLKNNKSDIVT